MVSSYCSESLSLIPLACCDPSAHVHWVPSVSVHRIVLVYVLCGDMIQIAVPEIDGDMSAP